MKLLIATGNAGKLREIRRVLEAVEVEVVGLDTVDAPPAVEEDAETFAGNALKKARTLCEWTGLPTLADDSGLEVEALGGAPGIHSARYAGEDATDRENNAKLLQALQDVPRPERQAAFRCVMALYLPDTTCHYFEGRLAGEILKVPRGKEGFGYDPLFFVPQYDATLAELELDVKNRISHRGMALQALLDHLRSEGLH